MRRVLRNRYLIPAGLLAAVFLGGLFSFGGGAGASGGRPATVGAAASAAAANSSVNNFNNGVTLPPVVSSPNYLGGPKNTGGANSTLRHYRVIDGHRVLVAYGNSAIVYVKPPAALIPLGEKLFQQNCASCHGSEAGGSSIAPNLVGVGPATVDFWVTTGRMPAADTNKVQAERKPPRLSPAQATEIAAWVNSLSPAVPYIPVVNTSGANLSEGADLFSLNCAACHTITGAGDALAYNTYAPTLHAANSRQVAEAIRTGPANMPRFTGNLNDNQVRDIVAYVTGKIQHPANPGGAGLGGVGPVTEGFIGLLFGVGGLMLICFWIGDRA